MNLDAIPLELTSRPQWAGFRCADGQKTPHVADSPQRKASSIDPRTWRSFAAAAAGYRAGDFDAVAYCLNGDFIGVDLDNCLVGGSPSPFARDVVERCGSYAEISYSGTGLHVLLAGELPDGKGHRLPGVEVYGRARFLITTGRRIPDAPAAIRANPAAIAHILGSAVTETAETAETTEAICVSLPVLSAVSVTFSLPELISCTTPRRPGQRNVKLLDLARGLRFNMGMADRPLLELKPIVRQWHEAALPVIRTKAFAESWADFCHAWPRARFPLGTDVLSEAWHMALVDPPPPAAEDYDAPAIRRLVCLCAALARLSPQAPFFLSTHSAARLLEVDAMQVHRWLRMLIVDGVLMAAHKGDEHRAARFRWIARAGRAGG